MGFKEKDLIGLFGCETRTKARQELETESPREEEEEGEENESGDDDDVGDDFHIYVRGSRGDEATSRGDVPGPSRHVPDIGEATATSTPSFQAVIDQLQFNLMFQLDSLETHWNFQFESLNAKIDSLSSDVLRILHPPSPPPPLSPICPDPPSSPLLYSSSFPCSTFQSVMLTHLRCSLRPL